MPNYRRAYVSGASYFFTVVSHARRPILIEERVRLALRQAIERTRIDHPFVIDAWVLLPDHMHCMWTLPIGDNNFSKRWSMIKRFVSQACAEDYLLPHLSPSRSTRMERGLWQRRFWEHQIRDENDFARHVDYVHWNPVKHQYAERVVDWPYSSFHRYVQAGQLPQDWGGISDKSEKINFGE